MMMASNSIPLHCNICPKKPNFSDVSHLLTHIASKGHLSHYYKVKVRSASEDASRRLIEAYDQWYVEWRVEDLMSERMSMKDKKKSRPRAASRALSGQIGRGPQSRSQSVTSVVDPRLAGPRVKDEPRPTPPPMFDRIPYVPQFDPRLRFWPSASPSSFGNTSTEYTYTSNGLDGASTAKCYTNPSTSAIVDDNEHENENEEADSYTGSSECTKLKGVYWPGMNIFDSATPEMRRKRNQKKDVSVVEMLESNSQEVEPTELIFTPRGSFKRQRRISGSSFEESSPIKSELSHDDPQSFRPVLADIDPNILRRKSKPASRNHRKALSRDVFQDDDEELGTRRSRSVQRKRKTFDVFQDEPATYHTSQTTSFNYLTSEFQYPQPPELPESSRLTRSFPAHGNLDFAIEEKENFGNVTFPYPTFYGASLGTSQPFGAYNSMAAPELSTSFYGHSTFYSPFHGNNAPLDREHEDDQRTITAPPSET